MTIMMSCDHHDEGGCVPDNRSRARILRQFAAAQRLADAFLTMTRTSALQVHLATADGTILPSPTVEVDLAALLLAWDAYAVWLHNEPRGDDLASAVVPPADIRVPPD